LARNVVRAPSTLTDRLRHKQANDRLHDRMSEPRSLVQSLMRGTHLICWALVVLGVVSAVAPLAVGTAIAVAIGLVLLAAGALIVLFGLRVRSAGRGNLGLVIGAATALGGLVLVIQPGAGLWLVRAVLIAYFLASGVSEVAMAWEQRAEEEWGWMLLGGIVSVVSAAVLWTGWPISGARAIGLVVGAKLASIGWAIVRFHRHLDAVGERVAGLRDRLR
jgi:uncharacterized membrane protein HdeD (DUF308 family)